MTRCNSILATSRLPIGDGPSIIIRSALAEVGVAGLIVAFLLCLLAPGLHGQPVGDKKIAVLDAVVPPDLEASAAGWADLVEHELRLAGGSVIERRRVLAVLKEVKISKALATGDAPPALPGVAAVVLPRLTRATDSNEDGLVLSLTLVSSDTGVIEGEATVPAVNLEDLPNATRTASQELIGAIAISIRTSRPPSPIGFTGDPDAASLFYRGLWRFSNGDSAGAIGDFAGAMQRDHRFYLARAWQARAFDAAGFGDFAQRCQRGLVESPEPEAKAVLALMRGLDGRAGVTADTRRLLEPEAHHDAALHRIARELGSQPGFVLIDRRSMGVVIAEADLRLAGGFEDLGINPTLSLLGDTLLVMVGDRIALVDAATGYTLAEVDTHESASVVATRLASARSAGSSADTVKRASSRGFDPSIPPTWHEPSEQPPADVLRGTRSSKGAAAMRRLIEKPNNLDHLVWAYKTGDDPMTEALHRIEKIIQRHPDTKDAPAWLAQSAYGIFENDFHRPSSWTSYDELLDAEPTYAQRYRLVLQHYPDSDVAMLLRLGLGMEAALAGNHAAAVERWTPLWERVTKGPPLLEGISVWRLLPERVSFLLAKSLLFLGNAEKAYEVFEPCRAYLERGTHFRPGSDAIPFRQTRKIGWYAGANIKLNHAHERDHLLFAHSNAHLEIVALAQRLEAVNSGRVEPGPYETSQSVLIEAVRAPLPEAIDLHRRSLRLLTEQVAFSQRVSPRMFEIAHLQVAFLRIHTHTAEAQDELERLMTNLAERLELYRDTRSRLYALAGCYEKAALPGWLDPGKHEPRDFRAAWQAATGGMTIAGCTMSRADQRRLLGKHVEVLTDQIEASDDPHGRDATLVALTFAPLLTLHGLYEQADRVLSHATSHPGISDFDRLRLDFATAELEASTGEHHEAIRRLHGVLRACDDLHNGPQKHKDYGWLPRTHDKLEPASLAALESASTRRLEQLRLFGPLPKPHVAEERPLPELPDIDRRRLFAMAYLGYAGEDNEGKWRGYEHWQQALFAEIVRQGDRSLPMVRWLLALRQWHAETGFTDHHLYRVLYAMHYLPDDPAVASDLLRLVRSSDWCALEETSLSHLVDLDPRSPLVLPYAVATTGRNCMCASNIKRELREWTEFRRGELERVEQLLDHRNPTVKRWAAYALVEGAGQSMPIDADGEPDAEAAAAVSHPTMLGRLRGDRPRRLERAAPFLRSAAFAREAPRVAIARSAAGYHVWSLSQGRRVATIETSTFWPMTLSPDGRTLVDVRHGDAGRQLRFWDVESKALRHEVNHDAAITAIEFARDPGLLNLAGVEVQTRRVSDWSRVGPVRSGHHSIVSTIHEPETGPAAGDILTGARDYRVLRWDAHASEHVHDYWGHRNMLRSIDTLDNWMVTASYDRTARTWRLDTNRRQHVYRGHADYVASAVLIRDAERNTLAVTGDDKGTIHIWSARTGELQRVIDAHRGAVLALHTYDDQTFWSVGRDGHAKHWSFDTPNPLADLNFIQETTP